MSEQRRKRRKPELGRREKLYRFWKGVTRPWKEFTDSEITIYKVLSVGAILLVIMASVFVFAINYDHDFWVNIMVEAHGMVFDVVILGLVFTWLNNKGERRREIKRYQEEIEDYLGWDEKEATFRIVGNIKRLNRLGISKINLSNSYLPNADLPGVNLQESDLNGANLQDADLSDANLQKANLALANLTIAYLERADLREANLVRTKLQETNLRRADLRGANLKNANLHDIDLRGANLENMNLEKAFMEEAYLRDANLKGAVLHAANLIRANLHRTDLKGAVLHAANLTEANLFQANLQEADLTEANPTRANLTEADLRKAIVSIDQLRHVKTLYQTKLDDHLLMEIKENYPHLLQKPREEPGD